MKKCIKTLDEHEKVFQSLPNAKFYTEMCVLDENLLYLNPKAAIF